MLLAKWERCTVLYKHPEAVSPGRRYISECTGSNNHPVQLFARGPSPQTATQIFLLPIPETLDVCFLPRCILTSPSPATFAARQKPAKVFMQPLPGCIVYRDSWTILLDQLRSTRGLISHIPRAQGLLSSACRLAAHRAPFACSFCAMFCPSRASH